MDAIRGGGKGLKSGKNRKLAPKKQSTMSKRDNLMSKIRQGISLKKSKPKPKKKKDAASGFDNAIMNAMNARKNATHGDSDDDSSDWDSDES